MPPTCFLQGLRFLPLPLVQISADNILKKLLLQPLRHLLGTIQGQVPFPLFLACWQMLWQASSM